MKQRHWRGIKRPTRQESLAALSLIPKKEDDMPKEKEEIQVTHQRPAMRQVSGGEFKSFEASGDCVEGYYQGYSYTTILSNGIEIELPKYKLENDLGFVEFLGTTQMAEILPRVPIGAYVMVSYIGKAKTTRGYMVKQFEIQLQEGVALLSPEKPQQAAAFNAAGESLDLPL